MFELGLFLCAAVRQCVAAFREIQAGGESPGGRTEPVECFATARAQMRACTGCLTDNTVREMGIGEAHASHTRARTLAYIHTPATLAAHVTHLPHPPHTRHSRHIRHTRTACTVFSVFLSVPLINHPLLCCSSVRLLQGMALATRNRCPGHPNPSWYA